MSIKDKHFEHIESDITDSLEQLKSKIKLDDSGSCWHKDEVYQAIDSQIKIEKNKTAEDKIAQPLSGLTIGVKDLFCIKGMTTTAGSRILEDFKSPYDSIVWSRLKDKGCILSVKCSMDEFAMGSFSNTSFLGRTSIPGKPDYSAGGSSGGSASSILAGLCDFSIGSDTGGSVRQPASFCGLVGYKPSYGAFSRFGMISYASSLDQAGFFTKTVEDLQYLISSQIAHRDLHDMSCVGLGSYKRTAKKIKKVGYFKEILEHSGIDDSVKIAYKKTLDDLVGAGVELSPVKIEYMDKAAEIYYIIACSEASSNLSRYQGVYFGKKLIDEEKFDTYAETISHYRSKYLGIEVQKRIMLGSFILSAENFTAMYIKAKLMREALKSSLEKSLSMVDTIVLPVSPTVALKWTEIETMTSAQIYMADFMTVPFSLAGVPAISLPWQKDENDMDIGMQFIGKQFSDYELIDSLLLLEKTIGKGI